MSDTLLPDEYEEFLRDIKGQIQTAQVRAAFAVSRELIAIYWRIGQGLAARQTRQGWGDGALKGFPIAIFTECGPSTRPILMRPNL